MDFNFRPYLQQRPLHTRHRRFVLRDTQGEAELFANTETTFLDEQEGAQTIEEQVIYKASCGHVVGFQHAAELISECQICKRTLCFRCGNLRCGRCLRIICNKHAKIFSGLIFCPWCRIVVVAQQCIFGLSRLLHRFLSKEF